MTRLRGRALRGERMLTAVPWWGHWKTTTFVAGLRLSGLSAPMVLDGAMNGAAFKAYTEQGSRPQPQARRYRRHGQPVQPQSRRCS